MAASSRPAPRSLLDGVDLAALRRAGHEGGPTGLVLSCLFDSGLVQHDPDDPEWSDRDRVLIDPALPLHPVAAVMARVNYPSDSARLGQGSGRVMADAVGLAHSSHAAGEVFRVFALLAQASLVDGGVWAALVRAGQERLGALTLLIVGDPACDPVPEPQAILTAAHFWHRAVAADPAEILSTLDQRFAAASAGPAALAVGTA